jgi:hypothetical protein
MFQFYDLDRIDALLSRTKANLGIRSDTSLSRLIHQITDYDKGKTSLELETDLHIFASCVRGSALSLLLDSCHMTIQDMQDDIASIGRLDELMRGGVAKRERIR